MSARARQRKLPSSDSAVRDLVELDKETRPHPSVAVSLGRLLLHHSTVVAGPLRCRTGLSRGAEARQDRHPMHRMVFLPTGTHVQLVDRGECQCEGAGDPGLFSSVVLSRLLHGAGATPAVHSMGPAPLAPVLVVGFLTW